MASGLILGKENRVMIENIRKDISEIKLDVKQAFNHMSRRLPIWATVLFTILGSLVTGLVVGILT